MASELDREKFLARMGVNLALTMVSGIFVYRLFPLPRVVFNPFRGEKMSKSR